MSSPAEARSPLSIIFLLHCAMEIPIAIQGVWSPASLPFLQLTNTTLVILKLYSALVLATCIMSFLCFNLPEFLPGKRALAIALCIYHTTCSTILYGAPRIVPYSFGPLFEAYAFTPEILWGTVHGFMGLGMVAWWQLTLHLTPLPGRA